MPDDANVLGLDAQAAKILSLLGEDEMPASDTADSESAGRDDMTRAAAIARKLDGAPAAPDAGPEGEASADTDAGADQPASDAQVDTQTDAPIEPPAGWEETAKEKFKALPHALQAIVADQEKQRAQHHEKSIGEAAEAKRQAQAAREALQRERSGNADYVRSAYAAARAANPAIAEGDRLGRDGGHGWRQLRQQNDAAAKAKYADYILAVDTLNARFQPLLKTADAGRDQAVRAAHEARVAAASDRILAHPEIGPLWKDEGRRAEAQKAMREVFKSAGYGDAEIGAIDDARPLIVAHRLAAAEAKAKLYDELMAQQARIAQAKKMPEAARPTRVAKPQAADDGEARSEREKGLLTRANRTANLQDKAALLARLL